MTETGFDLPRDERYFEDYPEGAVHEIGTFTMDPDELVAFAERFDPQPYHIDPRKAAESQFGGLIASGWHTASLMMRQLVDHYVSSVAALGSPGVDELRWLKPVRPGDELSVRVTVMEAKRSRSKPDRGIVRTLAEVTNQAGELVMSVQAVNFYLCREPG